MPSALPPEAPAFPTLDQIADLIADAHNAAPCQPLPEWSDRKAIERLTERVQELSTLLSRAGMMIHAQQEALEALQADPRLQPFEHGLVPLPARSEALPRAAGW